jgi:glycosyltransferase involved in cell wall biosynthesis
MPNGTRVIVVMPAYNAETTLERTVLDIPAGVVDEIVLCDDCSTDSTVALAERLGIRVIRHDRNKGYGANQKICYDTALTGGADVVVMIHPDYQYDPRVTPFAVGFLTTGICDVVIGSRVRSRRETLDGGMPLYKYVSNRVLTVMENVVFGQNLGDFHSGFRAYRRAVLETIDYHSNSDDFVFDTQFLAQAVYHGFKIGDVPIPTRYFAEASSINFGRSMKYGLLTVGVMVQYLLQMTGLGRFRLFRARTVFSKSAIHSPHSAI